VVIGERAFTHHDWIKFSGEDLDGMRKSNGNKIALLERTVCLSQVAPQHKEDIE
jgi:hypothetical protein